MKANEFARLNSFVNMLYYVIVMAFTMLFWHPFVLLATFIAQLTYNVIIDGKEALKYLVRVILPLFLLILIVNPLVNHRGVTVLFYLNNSPITRESLVFAVLSGLMVVNMLLIFYSFNRVMTSDKLLEVFSVFSKSFALIFTMTLRLLPRYREEFRKINTAQRSINEGTGNGGFFDRIRHACEIMNAVVTFALEDGIDTANAMTAQGYGLKGATRYRKNRFTKTDLSHVLFLIIMLAVLVFAAHAGCFYTNIFPEISISLDIKNIVFYLAYFITAAVPAAAEAKGVITWQLLKQKI